MHNIVNPKLESNGVFGYLAALVAVLLLIPLIAMQFTTEVNWTAFDFALMAVMLFSFGCVFIFLARLLDKKYWKALAIFMLIAFLWLWAELAVGVFTHWGS